jgi:hypothetical protein
VNAQVPSKVVDIPDFLVTTVANEWVDRHRRCRAGRSSG